MNFATYSQLFIKKAESVGYSADSISKCLFYAKTLIEKELPIIYDTNNLAGLVGYNTSYIGRAIVFTPFFYRKFKIKKKNGKLRELAEPLPSLKEIQDWILENILYKIPVSKVAKAYIIGTTLKQNLVFHKNQKKVLCIDIEDFFSNIRRHQIEKIFRHSGYSFMLSNCLSKLCCLHECLPQGASTSPYLSNLVMKDFDDELFKYCSSKEIRYTRYADDLTFSGDFEHEQLLDLIESRLKKLSLNVNKAKTRIMYSSQRQIVTGIVVNEKLQVSREKRKAIRQAIYYIQQYGLENHLEKIRSNKANYLSHLLGQVLHVLFINPEDKEFVEYKEYLNQKRKEL